jgi:hypothetical protein
MMKKTILTFLFVVAIGASVVACSKAAKDTDKETAASTAEETKEAAKKEEDLDKKDSKTETKKVDETESKDGKKEGDAKEGGVPNTYKKPPETEEEAAKRKEIETPFSQEQALEKLQTLKTSFDELLAVAQGFIDDPASVNTETMNAYVDNYFMTVLDLQKSTEALSEDEEFLKSNPETEQLLTELEKQKDSLSLLQQAVSLLSVAE